jgi:hypothetical protein
MQLAKFQGFGSLDKIFQKTCPVYVISRGRADFGAAKIPKTLEPGYRTSPFNLQRIHEVAKSHHVI